MFRLKPFLAVSLIFSGLFPLSQGMLGADEGRYDSFFTKVQPLLVEKCITCHGPDKQKGKLRVDSRAALIKGGVSGPAIVLGDPEKSLLIQAVRHSKDDLAMPPKDKLSPTQIETLAAWVKAGAPWPEPVAVRTEAGNNRRVGDAWSDPANPIVKIFNGSRLDLWSLKPVKRPALPTIHAQNWPISPVDFFVLSKLEAKGLAPSPEAGRLTLIRRLSFDLTGLPPSPQEMEAFLQDKSPDAYQKLVDRLLASPHYGERWGRHWLDVVRYADTNGFERDEFRSTLYQYRDYVIRSLNQDKPFDQFVREQLAGDEMVTGLPRNQEEADKLIATGFLRLGPYDSTRSIFQEDKKGHDELMTDLANTTGSAFLGMTIACCQCHNHKYDPLSQADHFRLRAFFAAVKFKNDMVIELPEKRQEITWINRDLDSRIAPLRKEADAIIEPARTRLEKKLEPFLKVLKISDEDAQRLLWADEAKKHVELTARIQELKSKKQRFATATAMTDVGREAPATFVYYQGDVNEPREQVTPGFLSILDPNPAPIALPKSGDTTGRRTKLAEWITDKHNPLTARVLVNRLWQHHFGRGIVSTPGDFGFSGAQPSHAQLLDWLAAEFQEKGWSMKHLHRQILLSATYRQDSKTINSKGKSIDPENILLWRQNPQRLDAETLRDSMLAVSGMLMPVKSGKPRWPSVPDDILKSQPAILEEIEGHSDGRLQGWYTDPEEKTYVRSVFLVQKRSVPIPFLQSFDLPDSNTSCSRRNVTTVAPQALTLFNSPFAVRISRAFAERVAKEAGNDPGRQVDQAFRWAFGRSPDQEERTKCLDLLARHAQIHEQHAAGTASKTPAPNPRQAALADLCRALFNLNEFVYVD